ncbi:MAG: RNA polymerase sigma factor [Propionibacteriaceae bacterium]|jgi:RNA polymerase sigma-70 factor (ECF subfamily)|nr:RNA polymerase sigma factor [Propionibacteriaceae bacterium]
MQDTQSFVTLYEQQYPRIVAYARRRLGALADAEDCAEEVFRLAWEQPTTPSVGWLFVTARNITYALHRADLRVADLAARLAAESATTVPDEDQGVLAALDQLPEGERELLMAFYWDDLGGTACAALLGCSVGAVWVRLTRARKHLKAVLLASGARPARVGVLPQPQGDLA